MGALKWEQMPDVMDVADVAMITRTSERTIRKLLNSGVIKAVKCGNKWLCAKENVMAYVRGEWNER